jgi:hypothetical protein
MNDTPELPPKPPKIITQEALDRWGSLPEDKALQITLTRAELDRLFLAIRESIIGQADLGAALLAVWAKDDETVRKYFLSARQHSDNAMDHIDRLIVQIMQTARVIEND